MSRRLVWTTTLGLFAAVALVGTAFAQYAGNGYPDRYYYEQDQDPGYGGSSVYRPFDYPENRRDREPESYNYDPSQGQPPYAPQTPYVDPYQNGRESSGPASDLDLGPSINRRTVTEVQNETHQPPGTIVIDTATRHLYFTQPDGKALRYGIGVGREGFAWKGVAKVERKSEWPDWIPPGDMLKRRPDLPLRMSGGIDNPLGARAMYLYQGNRDTLFRIHGTNEPDTIGKAVSSGCIRMMNGDVIDLYSRVPVGTKVVVL